MRQELKRKILETYIKEVVSETPATNRIVVQNEDTTALSPEQESIKKEALDVAKAFSDLNKKLLTIKDTYDKNAKSDLKRFVHEIFGDPFNNLSKMTQLAYEISENIILKLKISQPGETLSFKKLIEELVKILPEASKIIDELVGKYTEIKGVDDTIETQAMNEDFAQTFKTLLATTKNWAIKFNYKTEYIMNKVEQLYYKFKNPKLFSK